MKQWSVTARRNRRYKIPISTTDTLQGVEIKEYIGLVYGISQNFTGGIGKTGSKLMEKTMVASKEALEAAGKEIDADAILGLRITYEKGYMKTTGTSVKLKVNNRWMHSDKTPETAYNNHERKCIP